MKKKILLILILILILIGLLVSCTKNQNPRVQIYESKTLSQFTKETNIDEDNKIDELNIYHEKGGVKYNSLDSWFKYIYDKYDIRVNVRYNGYKTDPTEEDIIYINYHPYMKKGIYHIINNDKLHDLNKYFDMYNWNEQIEKKYIDSVTIGGSIKAIPCVDTILVRPRFYNKTYIDKIGIDVPESINEFTDYLKEVKKLMSDSTQSPMTIAYQAITQQTSDIFRGFGIYVGSMEESMIALNPLTNSYEDAVFSEVFDQAHNYFCMLEQTGIVKFENCSQLLLMDSNNLATEYHLVYNLFTGDTTIDYVPEYPCYTGYFLEGINKEKLTVVRKELSFYVFPDTISNLDSVMELFNNTIVNKDMFYDMKFGIYDSDYNIINDNIIVNDSRVFVDLNSPVKTYVDLSKEQQRLMENSFESNSLLDVQMMKSVFSMDELLSYNGYYTQKICNGMIEELFGGYREYTGIISSTDLVAEYKRNFLKTNGPRFVEILNEKLGLETKFDYSIKK